jgi:hypothetical protein
VSAAAVKERLVSRPKIPGCRTEAPATGTSKVPPRSGLRLFPRDPHPMAAKSAAREQQMSVLIL